MNDVTDIIIFKEVKSMKKTLKRAMLVTVVLTALVLMMSLAVSAASDCGMGHHKLATRTYEATCTAAGYTESYCTVCKNVLGTEITQDALGHDHKGVAYVYEAEGNYYKRSLTCKREGCGKKIYDTHLGADNQSAYDRYYLIELVNPFVADTYFADITYARVIEKHKEELLTTAKNPQYGMWFVKEGETLEGYIKTMKIADSYEAWVESLIKNNIVLRGKDKPYGLYEFSGWTYSKMDSGEFDKSDLINFADAKIYANDKIYAAFTGKVVEYTVRYVNADGKIFTRDFQVPHGMDADDSYFRPETVDGKVVYQHEGLVLAETTGEYYKFKGWSIDREHIYNSVTIKATYDTYRKVYEYKIKTWDEATNKFVESEATATATYGSPLQYELPEGTTLAELTARPKDRTYLYEWDGDWKLENGVKMSNTDAKAPAGSLDIRYKNTEGYAPVLLTPSYIKNYNLYDTTVVIGFASSVKFDGDEIYERNRYLNNLNVQITDASGQLVAKGKANLVEGTTYAQFKCALYDSTSYTVTVTSERGKYSGAYTLNRSHVYVYDAPVNIYVDLELDQGYIDGLNCSCICHNSLFKPIWVRVLNLLYNLFNVRYVCCDDMYASIGDLLAYA